AARSTPASARCCRRSRCPWKIHAAEVAEILLAMLAVAHAGAAPSIGENAIDLIHRHDLADHARHELEVIGAERAGYPGGRHRPMPVRLAISFHGDPVRMS